MKKGENKKIDLQNEAFQNALRLVQFTSQSLFLTGKAGTGKSTFLRYICSHVKKKYVVLAPTGIAAINVGGVTLHSFFKLPFYPFTPEDPRFSFRKIKDTLKYNRAHVKLLQEVELLIIDEISMVRADIIDLIDRILRIYTRNMRKPFGGKQVLFVGDMFQLEPVLKSDEREVLRRFYVTPFFFSASVFREIELVSIELTKVYRQQDALFISLLDKIRDNTISSSELDLINETCYRRKESVGESGLTVTLATRRSVVDYINQQRLDALEGELYSFEGLIKGDFPESSLPTQKDLQLKVGAQVIFIKNDLEKRWVNGTVGTVEQVDLESNLILVITDDGNECVVRQEQWNNIRYHYNEERKEIEEEVLGTFVQFPLKLAWAMTIHKSQGLTFSQVDIDFAGGVFAAGQTYVALSRCTHLQGISLSERLKRSDVFVRPEIAAFAAHFNDSEAVKRALDGARADITYQEAAQAFHQGKYDLFLDKIFTAIHIRYDLERPSVKRLIRRELGVISSLKSENARLREQLLKQEEQMRKYADEYYQMGDECVIHAHNYKAAIKNYDKAIELYPKHADAWVRKGVTLLSMGDTHEALTCFNHVVEMAPLCFKAWYHRGKLYLQNGDLQWAEADFDKAVSLNPKHIKAHEMYGDVLLRLGKEASATRQWAIAEELRNQKSKK